MKSLKNGWSGEGYSKIPPFHHPIKCPKTASKNMVRTALQKKYQNSLDFCRIKFVHVVVPKMNQQNVLTICICEVEEGCNNKQINFWLICVSIWQQNMKKLTFLDSFVPLWKFVLTYFVHIARGCDNYQIELIFNPVWLCRQFVNLNM